jgi:hypothetical protein
MVEFTIHALAWIIGLPILIVLVLVVLGIVFKPFDRWRDARQKRTAEEFRRKRGY